MPRNKTSGSALERRLCSRLGSPANFEESQNFAKSAAEKARSARPSRFGANQELISRLKGWNVFSERFLRLHYEQHKGVPTNCFGETEYFVTQVEPVGP